MFKPRASLAEPVTSLESATVRGPVGGPAETVLKKMESHVGSESGSNGEPRGEPTKEPTREPTREHIKEPTQINEQLEPEETNLKTQKEANNTEHNDEDRGNDIKPEREIEEPEQEEQEEEQEEQEEEHEEDHEELKVDPEEQVNEEHEQETEKLSSPTTETTPPTTPPATTFDYAHFLTDLKQCDPIFRYIKSFLQEFQKGGAWTPPQQQRIIADFMRFINVKLRDFEPFKSKPPNLRKQSLEGVEKFVTTRLYSRLYPPQMPPILRTSEHTECIYKDESFAKKTLLFSWLRPHNLDINDDIIESSFISFAETELLKLDKYKSPRDKLICLLNCSKVIFALIRQSHIEQNADHFLPILIYVVVISRPKNLISNLMYIKNFRQKSKLNGETAYLISSLESAIEFINSLQREKITCTDLEFATEMAKTSVLVEEQFASNQQVKNVNVGGAVLQETTSMLMEQFKSIKSIFDKEPPKENRDLETLEGMFPNLDREVLVDVLGSTDIRGAVEICLALSAE